MNLFSFIRQNCPILDLIGEYTVLKKCGTSYWKGKCPFHVEKTASFSVSPEKEIFYCFGCNESGDVISFISKIETLSQYDAAQILIKKYNLIIPEIYSNKKNIEQYSNQIDYFYICKIFSNWCNAQLLKAPLILNYLHSRGVTNEAIATFNIGFFPQGAYYIKELINYATAAGILTSDLLSAQILIENKNKLENAKNIYSSFEERIIFPIRNSLSQTIGFGGRILKETELKPKYYNSKENNFFKKKNLLFGIDNAKNFIKNNEIVYIVEGYFDCIAMHIAGFKNTVATLGTACSQAHLNQLIRYAKKIIFIYDGDTAGLNAIMRLVKLCWELDLEINVATLPSNEDPASIISKNQDLNLYINNAQNIFEFFLTNSGNKFLTQTLKDKLTISKEILDIINSLTDKIKKNICLLNASQALQIPIEILKEEFKKNNNIQKQTPFYKTKDITKIELDDQLILFLINGFYSKLTIEDKKILLEILQNENLSILKKLNNNIIIINFDKKLNFEELKLYFTENEYNHILNISFLNKAEFNYNIFNKIILQIKKKYWKFTINNIKISLTKAKKTNDSEKIKEIFNEFKSLKNAFLKSD